MGTTDNPNAANNNGLTPINVAAKGWHFEIVKTLMSTTDDPNVVDMSTVFEFYSISFYQSYYNSYFGAGCPRPVLADF